VAWRRESEGVGRYELGVGKEVETGRRGTDDGAGPEDMGDYREGLGSTSFRLSVLNKETTLVHSYGDANSI
jgi:hypothetical protein